MCEKSTGITRTTIWRHVHDKKELKRRNRPVQPISTRKNRYARLLHALSYIEPLKTAFHDMHDYVHVNEKWFYLYERKLNPVLASDEELELKSQRSLRYAPKVMFLCTVSRPRFQTDGSCLFDGKIGCWAFVEKRRAIQSSRLRPAGTMVTHPVNEDKNVYLRCII